MINRKMIQWGTGAYCLGALGCLGWLLAIPRDPSGGLLFGYSGLRLLLAALLLGDGLLWAGLFSQVRSEGRFSGEIIAAVDEIRTQSFWFWASLLGAWVLAFAVLHWRFAPAQYLAALERLQPILVYLLAVFSGGLLLSLSGPEGQERRENAAWFFVFLLIGFYFIAARFYAGVNVQHEISDQGTFINFARLARESNFSYTGGRNFMPLYPFVQALFINSAAPDAAAFEVGKLVNTLLSMLLLGGLYTALRRALRPAAAGLLALVAAFSLFIYKAAYFQPELLYYFWAFLAFWGMAKLLGGGDPRWAIGAGAVLALAHYTKASTLPALAAFGSVALLKLGNSLTARFRSELGDGEVRRQVLSMILVVVVYLGVLSPYLLESKRVYGQYFYNVNTTFYAWYDHFSEAREGTQAHGDRVGWPDMPADEIPSPGKYLREHSAAQIIGRIRRGLANQASNLANTFALVSYPLLMAAVGATAAWAWRVELRKWLEGRFFQLLFGALYLGGYLLLFAWYGAIAGYADQRLTYGLVIPMLFGIFVALEGMGARVKEFRWRGADGDGRAWLNRAYGLVMVVLAVDILFHLPAALSRFDWYGK